MNRRIKKLIPLLLTVALVLTASPAAGLLGIANELTAVISANAATTGGSCGTAATWSYDDETKELTISGEGAMGTFSPTTIPWLAHIAQIETITVESGITSICSYLAYNCTALTQLNLPETITALPNYNIMTCHALQSVTLPDSIISIGSNCINACNALVTVVFPANLESIGAASIYGCTKLNNFNLPNTLKTIGYSSIVSCAALTSVTLPDSVTSINYRCITSNASLTEINIGAGLSSFGYDCFDNNNKLAQFSVSASNTTYAAVDGILYSHDMTELVRYPKAKTNEEYIVPSTVTTFADGALANCSYLKSVILPDSLTTIGNKCLTGTLITTLTIPAALTSIGSDSLYANSKLTEIIVEAGNPAYCSIDGVLFDINATTLLRYPGGKKVIFIQFLPALRALLHMPSTVPKSPEYHCRIRLCLSETMRFKGQN